MLVALGIATAISATAGTVSMLAGGVVDGSDATEFWRTWWLGDTSGGLVVLPLMLAWAQDPLAAWRRIRTWEGAAVIAAVTALGVVAVSTEEPITYMVFPALIWAAFRFGAPGATLSIAITAGVAIGVTAHDVGPVLPAGDRPPDAQHAALHRRRCADDAVPERRGERTRAIVQGSRRSTQKRGRAGRGGAAPDSSRSARLRLPGAVLDGAAHPHRAEGSGAGRRRASGRVAQSLSAIAELTKSVQGEIRALIFELRRDPVHDGLVSALARHASGLRGCGRADHRSSGAGSASRAVPARGNPALRHRAGGTRQCRSSMPRRPRRLSAWRLRTGQVLVEVRDNGQGFDPGAAHPGHFGLDSMRSRATEIGGRLTIASTPGLWHRRPGPGPGGDGRHLRWIPRPTRASACW